MKSYISATGIKKVTISNPGVEIGKGGGGCAAAAARRFSGRTLLLLLLLLAIVPPFIFVRFAFLVLESASVCDSPLVENPSALSHLDEQGSEQTSLEAIAKMISQQDYLAKIHELRDGITCAWQAEDRVTSLKLSIKVTKLLMDTTVLQL